MLNPQRLSLFPRRRDIIHLVIHLIIIGGDGWHDGFSFLSTSKVSGPRSKMQRQNSFEFRVDRGPRSKVQDQTVPSFELQVSSKRRSKIQGPGSQVQSLSTD